MASRISIRDAVRRRLNDLDAAFWSTAEIDQAVQDGYRDLATRTRAFWDVRYAENLPRTFSYTRPSERDFLTMDSGQANYTRDAERDVFDPRTRASGPARCTRPVEATDAWLPASAAAVNPIAVFLETVHTLDRLTWDQRVMDALSPQVAALSDSRYEITLGEVVAFTARQEGLFTIRKIQAPSAKANTYTVNGTWGILRVPTDVTAGSVTGTWGFPRRIPNHHPMGPTAWGFPRRCYQEGKNVRVEHWREGRAVEADTDTFELPTRGTVYLRDYAICRCLIREGPAQDTKLATYYHMRYERGVARVVRRCAAQQRMRIGQLGGVVHRHRNGPPPPRRSWQYGRVIQW